MGASTAVDLTLMNEFEKLGCEVRLATEDGSQGAAGLVTETARLAIQDHRPDGLYACGPVKMLEAVEILAEQSHLPCQLSWEAHMRCGMGVCGSCELERQGHGTGWLTCLDGPVERSSSCRLAGLFCARFMHPHFNGHPHQHHDANINPHHPNHPKGHVTHR